MNEIYNFGAGPACLPSEVLSQIREDIPHWHDGMSVMEISHRLPVFMDLCKKIEGDLRDLLAIPDNFSVLFMQGGARSQFAGVPLNFLRPGETADYIVSGHWSALAYEEAHRYCEPHLVATSQALNYSQIPAQSDWRLSEQGIYCHYTDNETLQGVEFQQIPPVPGKFLVADMTSNILSRTIDFSAHGLIYASAQKNLGIAGITVVIVRNDLLGQANRATPSTMDYGLYAQHDSLYNTPPMFCWYVLGLMLQWAKAQGGCAALAQAAEQKSAYLYRAIDQSGFYTNPVLKSERSRINIPFRLPTEALEQHFLSAADQQGLKQLKGHKAVGGCRASLYNAMPMAGVEALINFMDHFRITHG